jgi:hypothetical protein
MTETQAPKAEYLTVINDGSARWGTTGRLLGAHHLGPGWVKIRFADRAELPFMLGETRPATVAEVAFAERLGRVVGFLGYTADLAEGVLIDEAERAAYAEAEARELVARRRAA